MSHMTSVLDLIDLLACSNLMSFRNCMKSLETITKFYWCPGRLSLASIGASSSLVPKPPLEYRLLYGHWDRQKNCSLFLQKWSWVPQGTNCQEFGENRKGNRTLQFSLQIGCTCKSISEGKNTTHWKIWAFHCSLGEKWAGWKAKALVKKSECWAPT